MNETGAMVASLILFLFSLVFLGVGWYLLNLAKMKMDDVREERILSERLEKRIREDLKQWRVEDARRKQQRQQAEAERARTSGRVSRNRRS